jgi:hypothetical protein
VADYSFDRGKIFVLPSGSNPIFRLLQPQPQSNFIENAQGKLESISDKELKIALRYFYTVTWKNGDITLA